MVRRLILSLAILLAMTGPALGDPPAEGVIHTNPDWVQRPTAESMIAVYPANQLATEHGGRVVLVCIVTVQGALRACRVSSETPAGAGFGAAALALVPQFSFRPATTGGQAVEAEVGIPIVWPRQDHYPRPDEPGPVLVSNAPWIRAPSFADIAAAVPPRARTASDPGRVVLGCTFRTDGTVRDCRIVTELPHGAGYGAAALSLTRHFQISLQALPANVRLADAAVMIPVTFPVGAATGSPPPVNHPRWLAAPTGEQAFAAYPAAALAAGASGRGVAACTVDEHGALTHCAIEAETPPGQGFGAAVVSLTPLFRMTLWTEDGLPTAGAPVRIPITLHPPEPDPPAPSH